MNNKHEVVHTTCGNAKSGQSLNISCKKSSFCNMKIISDHFTIFIKAIFPHQRILENLCTDSSKFDMKISHFGSIQA